MAKISSNDYFDSDVQKIEFDIPLQSNVPDKAMTKGELNNLQKQSDIIHNNKNHSLARYLVTGLLSVTATICIISFIFGTFLGNVFCKEIFEKTFSVLQYGIFAFLGYLFGSKNGNQN